MWQIESGKLSSRCYHKKRKPDHQCGLARQILNGIFYQLKNGCNWGDLPRDLPPYSTVFWHYKQWCEDGIWKNIMTQLHGRMREQVKKHSGRPWSRSIRKQWRTLVMLVLNHSCFCFYKATNGIKRHLAVDILGFPFFTHCTPANVSDDLRIDWDALPKYWLLQI